MSYDHRTCRSGSPIPLHLFHKAIDFVWEVYTFLRSQDLSLKQKLFLHLCKNAIGVYFLKFNLEVQKRQRDARNRQTCFVLFVFSSSFHDHLYTSSHTRFNASRDLFDHHNHLYHLVRHHHDHRHVHHSLDCHHHHHGYHLDHHHHDKRREAMTTQEKL